MYREGESVSKIPGYQHTPNHSALPRPAEPPKSRLNQTIRRAILYPEGDFTSKTPGHQHTLTVPPPKTIPPSRLNTTTDQKPLPPRKTGKTSKIPHQPNNPEGNPASTKHLTSNRNLFPADSPTLGGRFCTRRVILYPEGDSTSKTPGHQHDSNHSTLPRPAKPLKSRINQTTRRAIQHGEGHYVLGG